MDDIDASFNRRYKWFRTGSSRRAQRKLRSSNLISHATRRRARPRDSSSFVPLFLFLQRLVEGWKKDKGEGEKGRKKFEAGKNNCLPIEQLNLREKIPGKRGKKARTRSKLSMQKERERERERSNKPLGYTTRLHTGQSLFSFTPQITGRPVSATADRDRRRLIAVLIRISAELRRREIYTVREDSDRLIFPPLEMIGRTVVCTRWRGGRKERGGPADADN